MSEGKMARTFVALAATLWAPDYAFPRCAFEESDASLYTSICLTIVPSFPLGVILLIVIVWKTRRDGNTRGAWGSRRD